MDTTLYRRAKDIEKMDEKLKDLNSFTSIDVAGLQKVLFQRYESNSVLYDAIQKRQSVEESLEELRQVNRGIRKILPWRKNKAHNEKLKQIGELVTEPYYLHTEGIFVPDNLITTGAEITAILFGVSYLFTKYLLTSISDVSPEEIQQTIHTYQVVMPTAMSAFIAPTFGLLTNLRRFRFLGIPKCPTDQAKYLDEKVQEFYK